MQNLLISPKILTVKFVFMIFDLKLTQVAKEIHVANSTISMYLNGERKSPELELYVIEKVFNIKVKEFVINDAE